MKRPVALLLAASMMLPSHAFAWTDPKAKEPPEASAGVRPEHMIGSDTLHIEPVQTHAPNELVTAIVELRDEPVIGTYSAEEENTHGQALLRQQAQVQEKISALVLDGQPVRVLYNYTRVTNGFAAELPYGKLDEIRALGEVERVYVAPEFKMLPDMPATTNVMGGLENATGYKGEGRVIAIVDSGLDMTHAAFSAAPRQPALDQKAIAEGLTKNLRAETKYVDGTLTADVVYHGGKVPFAFDYADQDLDVNPGRAGDHGTHVAGIASANTGVHQEVVGVAPEAQLLAMKVFSSYGSGVASWENILAAMDDAVILGADVINLSLGSTCGFSNYDWEVESGVADTLKRVTDAGVSLSVACGNEYSAALDNLLGKGNALTRNPDYGTVASPSVYGESLAVASVEKKSTMMSSYLTVGQRRVAFYDISEASNTDVPSNVPPFRNLGTDKPLDYVVIPGTGRAEDYAGLTVAGKIALVSRGSITYEDKKNAARDAGAIGLLVYNNEPGMAYMQMDSYDLPAAFISQTDGEAMVALAESQRQLTISATQAEIESPTSGLMSDFSSWGVTPELTLKPDIAAPGGNILSTTIGGGYVVKSGTSMAAPFVTGAIAVTRQYMEQKHPSAFRNHQELSKLVDALLMSTADPVEVNGLLYSPRKQGAGSVSVQNAVASPAYLTAAGTLERPKLALGDDVNKTGVYQMSFDVHNWSDTAVTYTLGGTVQTDAFEVNPLMNGQNGKQVTGLPYLLGAQVPAQTVTVQPGAATTVTTTVTLTEGDKTYLDSNFVNGGYVEGFLTLTSDTVPTLSLPYLAFYGDWTLASAIDRGYYWEDLKGETNWASQYPNTAAATSLERTVDTYLGDNPYHKGVAYLADRNAISPNNDDYLDKLDVLYTGLLRNVEYLTYTITNDADGKVVYERKMDHIPKSVYSPGYFRIVPAGVDPYTKINWDGKNHGISLLNNSKLTVKVEAVLPYHEHAANNECLSWGFPLTIDIEAPTIKSVKTREEGGKFFVDLEVSDNQYVSNICFADASGLKELASYPVAEPQPGMTTVRSYDVTGMGQKLTLVVNDYAGNRREQNVTVSGNVDDSQVIVPTRTVFTENFETADFPANGWTVRSKVPSKTWYQGVESGSKVARCDFATSQQQEEWLISPAIDLSKQSTQAGMVFDFYANHYWSVEQHVYNLKIKASTDGQTWEDIWQLWDVKKEFGDWLKTQGRVIIPDKFQNAPALQLAFVYEGKDGASLYLDNVQVFVDDPTSVHTITASAGVGGSIAPEGTVKVSDKLDRTFTITPDSGYFIADVKVDGVSQGGVSSYTFRQVTTDHTIEAVFSAQSGGSAKVLVDVNFDDQAIPADWALGTTNAGNTWEPKSQYKGGHHYGIGCNPDTIDAPYPAQNELLILPALNFSGKSGSISFQFSGQKFALNKNDFHVTLEASADNGATWTPFWDAKDHISELKSEVISNNLETADMAATIPAAFLKDGMKLAFRYARPAGSENGCVIFLDNVKIIATEGQTPVPPADTFTITASAGQGGTIAPSGIVTVDKGMDKTFVITPSKGYQIRDVQVDGQNMGAVESYTFKAVDKAHTITATFEQLPETLPTSIQEDFNAGVLPEGWTVTGPSTTANYNTWNPGRYDVMNRTGVMLCAQNQVIASAQNEYLILPVIQMPAEAKLTFDFGGTYDHLKSNLQLTVQATLDKGASWTTIWSAADHLPQVDPNAAPEEIVAKGELAIPSNYCVDGVQFAFVFTSNQRSGGVAAIDNVVLTDANAPAPAVYQIKVADMVHGTVVTDKQSAREGELVRLEVRPEAGYRLQENSLKVNGTAVTGSSFTMPAEDVIITASFEQIPAVPEHPVYQDGKYEGQFMGHNDMVKVRVTVTNGKVAEIEILEQKETPSIWEKALAIVDKLIGKKNSDEIAAVDTITNATDSSVAIKTAVLIALEQAIPNGDGIFASGDGTALNPYMIQTAIQLTDFAASVNAGESYRGKYIALGKDLSLKEVTWTPIGRSDHAKYIGFSGTFDGRGHTISNITCGLGNAPARYEALGFFGVLDSGVVRNLNLKVKKYYNEFRGDSKVYTGGLVGIMTGNSLVDHCAVAGDVMCISENSGCSGGVGAIAGKLGNGSSIANSWSNAGLSFGTLNFNPLDVSMGGICGVQDINSVIMNCASFSSVPGNIIDGVLRIGGLVGQSGGAVYNCYTTGLTKANIVGTDPKQPPAGSTAVGHLVGSTLTGAALYQCYYDKNAPQFSNGDLAAEPAEGKEERRQAVGWDPGSQIRTDLTHVIPCETADMMQAAFTDTMNKGRENACVQAADTYFKDKGLLNSNTVAEAMTNLENGFYKWKLMGSTVLLDSTQKLNISVKDVADVSNVVVGLGVPASELPLPQKVAVTMSTNVVMKLPVVWDTQSYSSDVAASYPLLGELVLPEGITNPNNHHARVTVIVQTEAPETYPVAVAPMTNGKVEADLASAQAGTTVSLTITPDSGYRLKIGSLKANDSVIAGHSFTMPAEAVTITAAFEPVSTPPAGTIYEDGIYEGQATGKNGPVKVRVTVTGGAIAFVDVLDQIETPDYWARAKAVLARLLGKTTNAEVEAVDTVSNATVSSTAIKKATLNALEKAVKQEAAVSADSAGVRLEQGRDKAVITLSLDRPANVSVVTAQLNSTQKLTGFKELGLFRIMKNKESSLPDGTYTYELTLGVTNTTVSSSQRVDVFCFDAATYGTAVTVKDVIIAGTVNDTEAFGTLKNGITPARVEYVNYDANGDGKVNLLDLVRGLKYYQVRSGEADWEKAKSCDFNGDLVVDIYDYTSLLNRI